MCSNSIAAKSRLRILDVKRYGVQRLRIFKTQGRRTTNQIIIGAERWIRHTVALEQQREGYWRPTLIFLMSDTIRCVL